MGKQPPTAAEIIDVWKKLDAKSDKWVGVTAVCNEMGISQHWVWKLFAGQSLTELKRKHGIKLSPQEDHKTDDELLEQLDAVVAKTGKIPGWLALGRATGIHEGTWKKRLGGSKGCAKERVYARYLQWLRSENPESPQIRFVEDFLKADVPPKGPVESEPKKHPAPTYTKNGDAPLYGPLLSFGNLTYAPTNEQGVVFLFGMVSKALGFESVEYVRTDFPDCEAKRRVGNKGHLQHVRIEFEFRSRNYDHPIDGCDLIVCWEHNWRDCPLEVIELRSKVEELRSLPEF